MVVAAKAEPAGPAERPVDTTVPADRLQWIFTKQDFYRDPDAKPDIVAIQRSVDMLKEFNFVKADLDVKTFADLGMLEEASRRIK